MESSGRRNLQVKDQHVVLGLWRILGEVGERRCGAEQGDNAQDHRCRSHRFPRGIVSLCRAGSTAIAQR